ncbi:ABC transporter ATP-binding protein [bacterium]|nr:ABC transporter ATP-binding protein [bacterium]
MQPKIRLENIAFGYDEQDLFSGLNLELFDGEVVCVLGANGCGKTTLLQCLNGSLKLTRGSVCLDGKLLSTFSVKEVARKMGFVFQEHNAPFPYSVLEVVRMGRAPHLGFFSTPSEEDNEIAEYALEMVGKLHLKDKPYTQISGGERQLVLIARTIAQEPEVILLDEPTSHLDFKNQTLVMRIITKLARRGFSIVMSSHWPDHALQYASKVVIMNNGEFSAVGPPGDVITEENLKLAYNMDVNILSVNDSKRKRTMKFCVPVD